MKKIIETVQPNKNQDLYCVIDNPTRRAPCRVSASFLTYPIQLLTAGALLSPSFASTTSPILAASTSLLLTPSQLLLQHHQTCSVAYEPHSSLLPRRSVHPLKPSLANAHVSGIFIISLFNAELADVLWNEHGANGSSWDSRWRTLS